MPLSVFKHKWENEFHTVYNKLDIPDDIHVGDTTSVPIFDFEEAKILAFDYFLRRCESIVASCPTGQIFKIDADIFLMNAEDIITRKTYYENPNVFGEPLWKLLHEVYGSVATKYLFIDNNNFCVSLSVWEKLIPFTKKIKKIESTEFFVEEFGNVAKNIKQFEGWSLSISIDEAKGVLKKVAEYSEFYIDEDVKAGRPNGKYKRVLGILQKHYPDGTGKKTKKEIMREHELGDISEKTVGRAMKDFNNRLILRQNNGQN